jgi:sec-independent protein translocase protein TatA
MVPEIGIPGLILILVVALLVFGPKRLPEMGRSLGRGMREFKDSISGHKNDDDDEPVAQRELPATPVAEKPVSAASREHDTV